MAARSPIADVQALGLAPFANSNLAISAASSCRGVETDSHLMGLDLAAMPDPVLPSDLTQHVKPERAGAILHLDIMCGHAQF